MRVVAVACSVTATVPCSHADQWTYHSGQPFLYSNHPTPRDEWTRQDLGDCCFVLRNRRTSLCLSFLLWCPGRPSSPAALEHRARPRAPSSGTSHRPSATSHQAPVTTGKSEAAYCRFCHFCYRHATPLPPLRQSIHQPSDHLACRQHSVIWLIQTVLNLLNSWKSLLTSVSFSLITNMLRFWRPIDIIL